MNVCAKADVVATDKGANVRAGRADVDVDVDVDTAAATSGRGASVKADDSADVKAGAVPFTDTIRSVALANP